MVRNFVKKETLEQVFSCEFFEIFENSSFYRTPPVAVSLVIIIIVTKLLLLQRCLKSRENSYNISTEEFTFRTVGGLHLRSFEKI